MYKRSILISVAVIIIFGAGYLAGSHFCALSRQMSERVDTLVVDRTIVDSGAFLAVAKNRGYELVRSTSLDSLKHIADKPAKTVYVDKPTVIVRDSIVYLQVPMEERTFAGSKDSVEYKITTTGYNVDVTSVAFTYPQRTVIRTQTIKPRRLGVAVTAGPGVVLTPSGNVSGGLCISAGLSWRF